MRISRPEVLSRPRSTEPDHVHDTGLTMSPPFNYQPTLMTALEQMPAFPAPAIEPGRHRTLQLMPPRARVQLRGLHRQVKMVRHQPIGVNPLSDLVRRLKQGVQKRFRRSQAFKQIPATTAAVDHVVQRSRVFDT